MPSPFLFFRQSNCVRASRDCRVTRAACPALWCPDRELLLDSIETHYTELNNSQYYQRQLAREQAKILAWQTKRKQENLLRAAAKQPLLPENEWNRLFKPPVEPSRLETLLNSRQIEQYAKQVDGFTASVTAKMFAVNGGLSRTHEQLQL